MTGRDEDARLPEPAEPHLPEALHRELQAAFGRHVEVPDRIDRAVLGAAQLELHRPRPRIQVLRPVLLAAALLVAALSIHLALRSPAGQALFAREDFDGSGRVDVLDAYRLALCLERHQPVDLRFDLDGNGRIDRADVDTIARAAVSVREEPR